MNYRPYIRICVYLKHVAYSGIALSITAAKPECSGQTLKMSLVPQTFLLPVRATCSTKFIS